MPALFSSAKATSRPHTRTRVRNDNSSFCYYAYYWDVAYYLAKHIIFVCCHYNRLLPARTLIAWCKKPVVKAYIIFIHKNWHCFAIFYKPSFVYTEKTIMQCIVIFCLFCFIHNFDNFINAEYNRFFVMLAIMFLVPVHYLTPHKHFSVTLYCYCWSIACRTQKPQHESTR